MSFHYGLGSSKAMVDQGKNSLTIEYDTWQQRLGALKSRGIRLAIDATAAQNNLDTVVLKAPGTLDRTWRTGLATELITLLGGRP